MTAKILIYDGTDEEVLEQPRQYASPPCYQHEIDPLYQGIPSCSDLATDEDLTGITNKID